MILVDIKNVSETIAELLVVTFENSERITEVPEDQKNETEVPIFKSTKSLCASDMTPLGEKKNT